MAFTRIRRRLLAFAVLAFAVAWASAASAATITVTTAVDELAANGTCSLREALRAANLNAPEDGCSAGSAARQDIIRLPAGRYELALKPAGDDVGSSGDLDVIGSVEIQGLGPKRTIVDGGGFDRVFEVLGGGAVTLFGLTIQNGLAAAGGGIQISGSADVLFDRIVVRRNAANLGGGILDLSSGDVVIRQSRVSNNEARGAAGRGGGIVVGTDAHLSLRGSTVSGNLASGGAPDAGGGIRSSGSLLVRASLVHGNRAPNGGGGGIGSRGSARLDRSTVSGNSALLQGGGLASSSVLALTNTTVSGNTVQNYGGGVFNDGGALTLSQATITLNSSVGAQGGGLATGDLSGSAIVKNSILGANSAASGGSDCYGTIASEGRNLIEDESGCTGVSKRDIVGSKPRLGPLKANGGPVPTHRLLRASRALDRGTGCTAADGRGVPRPQGPSCDLGAYELARCGGRVVDVVGTPGKDRIVGRQSADIVLGLGGADRISGRGGNDVVCGGFGNDVLLGGPGSDVLRGGAGTDNCAGGPGADIGVGCERTSSLRRR